MWLITDRTTIETDKNPMLEILSHKIVVDGYMWSEHSKEQIKKSWVRMAESAKELAEHLQTDEKTIARTLSDYNSQTDADGGHLWFATKAP